MNQPKVADLVLEGGGVKGIALAGAYSVLAEKGYRINRVAGTSAGAIVGALIAADITAAQLHEIMREIDYRRFEDQGALDRLPLVGKGLSLLLEKGIYEGEYLRKWLDELLTDLRKRTWADMRLDDPGTSLPADRSYRLVVMSSDVSCGRLVRFPWDYDDYGLEADQQLVADAVRASMSIPFFYEPVKLNARSPGAKPTVSYLVDGGMLSNFPVDVFDRTDGKPPRWPTFGIKLSARPESAQRHRFKVDGTLDLARAMLGTMTSFYDQMHIENEAVLRRTIFVDTTGVKSTDFDLDEATQERLFENGRAAAVGFLEDWDFEEYVRDCRAAGVTSAGSR